MPSSANSNPVNTVSDRLRTSGLEIEHLELPLLFLVAAAAVCTDDRQDAPDDLVAGGARDLAEAILRNRKRRDAALDAGDVNPTGPDSGRSRRRAFPPA